MFHFVRVARMSALLRASNYDNDIWEALPSLGLHKKDQMPRWLLDYGGTYSVMDKEEVL
jgi:hypothetical protein